MKKIILVIICIGMCSGLGLWGFEKGTIGLSGSVTYLSHSDKDEGFDLSYNSVVLAPGGSYFLTDNFCLDLEVLYRISWADGSSAHASYGLGIGARYFIKRFYGGFDLRLDTARRSFYTDFPNSDSKVRKWDTRKEAGLKVGYMLPLARNVYVDLGAFYRFGLGTTPSYVDYYERVRNNRTQFGTSVGIAIFIK